MSMVVPRRNWGATYKALGQIYDGRGDHSGEEVVKVCGMICDRLDNLGIAMADQA
jgi:hypothetical protein